MIYRLYNDEDFDRLYALEVLCFEPPFRFSRRTMRALVQRPNSATWIAEENGQMTGFAVVEWTQRKNGVLGDRLSPLGRKTEITAYIQTIEVAPEARRHGVGRELLNRIEGSAREAGAALMWLHVEAENRGAIRLYEAQGYCCQGRKENFYPQGLAGLTYQKRLDSVSAISNLPSACPEVGRGSRVPRAS